MAQERRSQIFYSYILLNSMIKCCLIFNLSVNSDIINYTVLGVNIAIFVFSTAKYAFNCTEKDNKLVQNVQHN